MKRNLTKILIGMSICGTGVAQNLMTGPSTTATPYMWPAVPNATVKSILTAGDVVSGYTLSGLGDGMGAFENGGSTFTLVINHEMGSTAGAVHAHGQTGAFVSKWVLNKSNLSVVSGSDLIQNVKLWSGGTYTTYNASNPSTLTAFARFCAGELASSTAFYNTNTGKGTTDKIFINGEENGPEGRAFAHIVTGTEAGTTYELPHHGKLSFENAVASPYAQDKTIVIGLDDATPGQVYVYVGQKSTTGNTIEKAGLFGGRLYGVSVVGFFNEGSSVPTPGTAFNLIDLGSNVASSTGSVLNTNSNNLGVTNFLRPEDGAWDPNRPSDFYFVTTNSFTNPSRLWRLRFNDINNPELGGKIEAVLAGTEGPKMMDNMVMDNHGHILIQEDPGGQNHTAKIWQYKISTDAVNIVIEQDSTRFKTGGVNFLTIDEESSGVIDMQGILGAGWFLAYDQAHYSQPLPVVEGGQLLAFFNPATAAANPEINLTGNGISIPDGNTSTSSTNNTNFGAANVGMSVSKSFVIQNTNSGSLIVSSLNISGINAGDFTIQGPFTPFTVGPNASQTITVTFAAPLTGTRSAMLNVVSSDFDENAYNFALEGTGVVPEINLTGNSTNIVAGSTVVSTSNNTDFGMVYLGNSTNQNFVIQNTGNGTLTINNITISGLNSNEFTWVNAPTLPLTLSGNSSQTLTLKFLPLALGTRVATVMVNSNDADESSYSFNVQGNGATDVGLNSLSENISSQLSVYPNPSNYEAMLKFTLNATSKVAINVFDIQGKLALSLTAKEYQQGEHTTVVNTSTLTNGEYFITVNSANQTQTIKLIVAH
ncbi:MAG: choice-of-anchor D domain-containing protein [Bacteroidia bacterium]|nr:choice-of-anchor D domain-containing protein [Bacteroidia bacterium]